METDTISGRGNNLSGRTLNQEKEKLINKFFLSGSMKPILRKEIGFPGRDKKAYSNWHNVPNEKYFAV